MSILKVEEVNPLVYTFWVSVAKYVKKSFYKDIIDSTNQVNDNDPNEQETLSDTERYVQFVAPDTINLNGKIDSSP